MTPHPANPPRRDGRERLAAADYFDAMRWDDLPELVPACAAAERLGVSRQTVYRLVREGELQGIRVGRGNMRLFRRSLVDYLRRRLT